MSAQEHRRAVLLAEFVHGPGQAPPGGGLRRRGFQRQFGAKQPVIDLGELQRNHAEAYPALPGLAEHRAQPAVDVGLQIGRFGEALAALIFGHVVVADLDGEGPNALSFRAHLGEEMVGHALEHGQGVFFVGEVGGESLLLAVTFGGRAGRDDGPLVDAVSELPEGRRGAAQQQCQQLQWRGRDVGDLGESRRIEPRRSLRPDAGQPAVGQRMEKPGLLAGGDDPERRRLVELRGNLADQLVGADPFADGELEGLKRTRTSSGRSARISRSRLAGRSVWGRVCAPGRSASASRRRICALHTKRRR